MAKATTSTHANSMAAATAKCTLALSRSLSRSPLAAGMAALLMQRNATISKTQEVLP
jgi:hypothetical protein